MSYYSDIVICIHEDAITPEIQDLLESLADKTLHKNHWELFHLHWVTWNESEEGDAQQIMDFFETIEEVSQYYFLRMGEDFGDKDTLGEGLFNETMPFFVHCTAHLEYGVCEKENTVNVEELIKLLNTIRTDAEDGNLEPLLIIHDFMEKIDPKYFANS